MKRISNWKLIKISYELQYRVDKPIWLLSDALQGRFKSWFVTDEAYLHTLILYIEQNPVKAKIVERVEEYPYSY